MLVTEVIEVIGSTPPFVVMRTFAFAIAKCLWNVLNDSLVGICGTCSPINNLITSNASLNNPI
uniref:Uncharacterized protein n=1 Tax=Rhizophagus irregularis (strain DAOM 181602 / DAOM 197198 / MUCL 43194) TaxID=747089 RepID=U9TY62_RHIID